MDPITGQGIGHALGDAELVSNALEAGLGGRRPLGDALAEYQTIRDRDRMPMYDTTLEIASFARSPEEGAILFGALAKSQEHTDQFLGVITGSVSPEEFFSPRNLVRVLGLRGMAKMARLRMRSSRGRDRRPEAVPA
jgi:hypothetical protein